MCIIKHIKEFFRLFERRDIKNKYPLVISAEEIFGIFILVLIIDFIKDLYSIQNVTITIIIKTFLEYIQIAGWVIIMAIPFLELYKWIFSRNLWEKLFIKGKKDKKRNKYIRLIYVSVFLVIIIVIILIARFIESSLVLIFNFLKNELLLN